MTERFMLYYLIFFQAEIVDQIEYNVQQTKDFVDSGTKNLTEAKQKQRSARKVSNLFGNRLFLPACFLLKCKRTC
jgi:t-SNARE complex subunit (syntaxin)